MGTYKNYTAEEKAAWPSGHKSCRSCQAVFPFTEFHKHKQALFGYANVCKECRKPASKAQWAAEPYEVGMLRSAGTRAKKFNREFTITLDDIIIPDVCPILGVPIVVERNHKCRPSIDRIDSNRGYTPDNIMVVSFRGNTLKNNMTHAEAMLIAKFLSHHN